MPDVSVSQTAFSPNDIKPIILSTPTYLLSFDWPNPNTTAKKGITRKFFLATKIDETVHTVKCIGFWVTSEENKIASTYPEIIKETDPKSFVEIAFPWQQIISVRSLAYRHKVQVQK